MMETNKYGGLKQIAQPTKDIKFETKVDAFNNTHMKKGQVIKWKGLLCRVTRIESVTIDNGYVIIKGKLNQMEEGEFK